MINLTTGAELPREELMRRLVDDRYERNDIAFERNMFRVRGDTIELWPAYWASSAIRVEYFGDEIDRISEINPVTGEVIRNPGNYIVKLGTNVQEIIDHCGGITGDDVVLKMGGPMMGAPIKDTNVPIIKGSNGIIAIAADHTEEKECIKCGRCMDVCPMELAPLDIYKYAQLGDAETLLKLNVMDCFSCKCCEYICSSKIPLVSKINAAKGLVMPLLKKK